MTGKQNAVLWIGLIIVAMNLVAKWSSIKAVIFAGASGSSGSSGGGISTVPGIPAPSGGGVTIPFGGFPITVPLAAPKSSAPVASTGVQLV